MVVVIAAVVVAVVIKALYCMGLRRLSSRLMTMTNNLSCKKILIEAVKEAMKYSGDSTAWIRRLTVGRDRKKCKAKCKGLKILERIDEEREKKSN